VLAFCRTTGAFDRPKIVPEVSNSL
jgi:hypothetical protein